MIRLGSIDENERQSAMMVYISAYGMHFNKKSCDFAVSIMMGINHINGRICHADPLSRMAVERLLYNYEIVLDNAVMYDHVYMANKIKTRYWKSAIEDEEHLARAIKDAVDDINQNDGFIFNEWVAEMQNNGIRIDWDSLI